MNFKKHHVSKNLLSTTGAQSGYIESNGNIIQGHANLYYTDFISIPVGAKFVTQSYAPKSTGMYTPSLCFYDSNKTYITGEDFNNSVNKTFEVPQNAKYIRTCYRTTMEWCMLNVGSSALPYEPYSSEVWHDIPIYIRSSGEWVELSAHEHSEGAWT